MTYQSYWLAFHLVPEVGVTRLQQLWQHFGDLSLAWRAAEVDLLAAGLPESVVQKVVQARRTLNPEAEYERVMKCGATLLTLEDAAYPALLRKITDPPPVLYIKGALHHQDELSLGVVGTRNPSRYGLDATHHISYQLAQQGVTIISGLAQGIDAAAHGGALKAQGRTIAVLGNGIDRIYPTEHHTMAEHITQHGAIITEFPIGMPPHANNFPRRNRLISGLALGVLIGEAPEKSGALITAESALEQGREVFVIPGNIFNPLARGSNRLIQEGAMLVMGMSDILNAFNLRAVPMKRHATSHTKPIAPPIDLEDETEALIFSKLSHDPIHVDDLIRDCGLAAEIVSGTLALLELKGLAQKSGPMQYSRTH